MTEKEIIDTLKSSYPREIRKQLVKSIQDDERDNEIPNYKIINQIFSYVLHELGWNMSKSSSEWDNSPLELMKEVFPHIEDTKWYQNQILTAKRAIEIQRNDRV